MNEWRLAVFATWLYILIFLCVLRHEQAVGSAGSGWLAGWLASDDDDDDGSMLGDGLSR